MVGVRSSGTAGEPLEAGGWVRGYRLVELVGEGAFALVWRAEQPTLDREVAIKQIRSELANEPEFIRRFEVEAQVVASLEHPYVVPLHDYWREPDAAFLVLRLFRGGTLGSLLAQQPLPEGDLRRLVAQVGAALRAAHRAGVVHRDVKPGNVLLDDEANFYLGDFGIASSVGGADGAGSVSVGSPAYAAPEQLRRESAIARSDIYSFGVTVFEAATGQLPFGEVSSHAEMVRAQLEDPVPAPSTRRPGVPGWVDELVAAATRKDPEDRCASMEELLGLVPAEGVAVSRTGQSSAVTWVGSDLRNPFKALRAFGEADSGDFYGRDQLVERLLKVLARPDDAGRLVAVVGPSGSGKSSAVRAGLIPALRRGAVPGSADWFVTTMVPGRRPFEELEAALVRVAEAPPGPLVELMAATDRGITRAINQILPAEDDELVVVIDQFEELFTHTIAAHDRERFIDGLVAAVTEPRSRLRVVVTIRADFWDRPLAHPGLGAMVEAAAVGVTALAPDELEQVIVRPVEAQGAQYEPGLVAQIIADVRDQPGALPLLQYTLTELFDRHTAGVLTTDAYAELGGISGALAKRAEHTYTGLDPDQQAAARGLFGRLVSLGEGTDDTRRRILLTELNPQPETRACIDAFGQARLLTFDRDPTTRDPTVEIAHEALLTAWPRLHTWIDEDREGLRIHRHLGDTAAAWLASDRDPGELYRGGRLESAQAWHDSRGANLNAAEHEFLDASIAAHEAEHAAQRERFQQQARSNRRLRVLTLVASAIAVGAVVAGILALQQRTRANDKADEAERNAAIADQNAADAEQNARAAAEQRDVANVQRLRADAVLLAGVDDVSLLLAVEADRLDPSVASKDVLHRVLTAGPSSPSMESRWPTGNPLEEHLLLPAEQADMLEEPGARFYTAILDDGDTVLTSVEMPDRTSTVVAHERDGSSWTTTDTGIEAIVAGRGDFALWVAEDIVIRSSDGTSVGLPIQRPPDLISFALSDNGETVVLLREGAVLDVHGQTGELIGSVTVPNAQSTTPFVISVLADGQMIAARQTFERIGPWALWTIDPLELEASGTWGFGQRFSHPLEPAILNGDQILAQPTWSNRVMPFDAVTRENTTTLSITGAEGNWIGDVDMNGGRGLLAMAYFFEAEGLVNGAAAVFDLESATQLGGEITTSLPMSLPAARSNRPQAVVQFAGDDRLIVQHPDGLSVWNYDTSTWADIACDAAGRNLSRQEWSQYGPTGVDYRKTCEQYPLES